MNDDLYPEHEKLSKISDESQAIGQFLDIGLPNLNLILYEPRLEACDCEFCERLETKKDTPFHSDAAEIKDGVAYYKRYRPTHRNIKTILAEHFGIDQEAIDREKDEMLKRLRGEEP